ncbi:Uncharacterized conserved protein YcbK, DUF882 family [Granulicella pectinivorans]|uniref:Murein endopeptidase K n=2 Tax=Granulicella pectinivorans TaxID=474950 RepID=A0A1I6L9U5_9BACT|nr:Uncharacterized conserved protein YcbK, DUF882 family [Granulicella pectinivorans]
MFVRTSTFPLRSLTSFRVLSGFVLLILMGVAVPSASARNRSTRRHTTKFRAMAHAFVDVALPAAGLLPESEADLPVDGLKYELKLVRSHTDDAIDVVYRIGDVYMPGALMELNHFLRDSHNQEVSFIDPRTFDVLHTMLAKLGKNDSPIDILSGFRSQETNDMLRQSGTTNAAEHSQHIEATAIDLRVPGVPAPLLRDAAKSLAMGGVGYYPAGQFVHVDVGPVREWTFSGHAARARHKGSRRSRRNRRA